MPPADLINRLQLAQARCLEILGEMDQAIALAQRVVETERSATQLPALIRLARLYERTSQYDEALQTLHTALPLADPLSIEAAKIWNIFGLIYRYRSALDESIAAHGKALTICKAIDDPLELAESQANLSLTYRVMADYETAVFHLEQALAIAKRLDHQEKISGFTHSLGVLYWQQDDLVNAQACMTESLAIAEQLNHKRLMAICANGLGVIARRTYEHDKALRHLHRALRLAEEVGDMSLQSIMVGIIGLVYQDIGDYEQAIAYLQKAADQDRSMGTLAGVGRHLGNIGDAHRLQQQYVAALPYFEEAIELLRQTAAPYYLCWVLVSYAYCLFEVGRIDEARVANAEGGRVAAEIGREVYELFSLLLAARIQAQTGDVAGAIAHIHELRSRFTTPEFTAEIDFTLWQISGDAAHRETAVTQITALYKRTQIDAYRIRLENV
jgi:tetratricopeptide (TPR) repeat protein